MTKYKSHPVRKIIPSNAIPINYKYLADNIGDIESVEGIIDIFFDGNLGRGIGVFQPGWNTARSIKGNASELFSFVEIMSVSYSPYSNFILSQWGIHIRACIKEDNVKVKEFIKTTCTPIVQQWLSSSRQDTWYLNRKCLQIGLNEDFSKYCLFETQDGNIINKVVKEI